MVLASTTLADTIVITNDIGLNTNVTKSPGDTGIGYVGLNPAPPNTPTGDLSGCNANGTNALTVNLQSSNAQVTLTDSFVTITDCDTDVPFDYTVGAGATGTAVISVLSYSGGRSGGLYVTTDTLVITINGCTAPAAPTINTTGGALGNAPWYTAAPTLTSTPSTGVQWAAAVNGGPKSAFSPTAPILGTGTTIVYAKAVSGACASAEASETFHVDPNAPTITDNGPTSFPNGSGWYNADVTNTFTASDGANESGIPASFTPNPFERTTSGEGSAVSVNSGSVTDVAGNTNPGILSAAFQIDLTDPTVTCNTASFALNQSGAIVTATVTDELSGPASSSVAANNVDTSTVGVHSVSLTGYDVADNTTSVSCAYTVAYNFVGFDRPVDNGTVLNVVKAGQAVPLKFRLVDANNEPVLTGVSASVSVSSLACSAGTTSDLLEEVASGSSGLQNIGDGYYQFNWKTPTSYASSCKTMRLNLGEGGPTYLSNGDPNPAAIFHTALFQFRK
jgi:hypothetical protein